LPHNVTRPRQLQTAILFVAMAYLAAGRFFAPLIAGREPRGQGLLLAVRLGARACDRGRCPGKVAADG
jgi:nitric oxide reductase subunit B